MSKSKTNTKTVNTVEPTVNNYEDELKNITTKSGKIRFLSSKGVERGSIAKMLNIRYQHVRNVLVTPLKKV
jgi:hypothetical protein